MPPACPTACTREYLRKLFLDNDLAEGRFVAARQADRAHRHPRAGLLPSAPTSDHVAPWRSTYKINLLTDAEVTYRPHHRRPQCRHRVGARPRSSQLPGDDTGRRRTTMSTPIPSSHTHRARTARGGRNGWRGSTRAPVRRSHRRWACRPPSAHRSPMLREPTCSKIKSTDLRSRHGRSLRLDHHAQEGTAVPHHRDRRVRPRQ